MKTTQLFALCGALSLTIFNVAHAQTAPNANTALLPGDLVPPPEVTMGRMPAGFKPPATPVADVPSPSLALALEAAQAAVDACLKEGQKVGAAVVDSSGEPRATLAADGITGGYAYTAVRKGLVAIAFKTSSSEARAKIASGDKAAIALVKPTMMTFPGAVPLIVGDRLVGAVAVSGATNGQDEKCAAAGAAKIKSKLN